MKVEIEAEVWDQVLRALKRAYVQESRSYQNSHMAVALRNALKLAGEEV